MRYILRIQCNESIGKQIEVRSIVKFKYEVVKSLFFGMVTLYISSEKMLLC